MLVAPGVGAPKVLLRAWGAGHGRPPAVGRGLRKRNAGVVNALQTREPSERERPSPLADREASLRWALVSSVIVET